MTVINQILAEKKIINLKTRKKKQLEMDWLIKQRK